MSEFRDGIWLIRKPAGPTSHDMVYQARRILGNRDVGHCGTLDPMAQGLLILTSGEATKVSQYLLEGNKQYLVGVRFGKRTDTLDCTGQVLEEKPFAGTEQQIIEAALALQGEFEWKVPVFSAKKVNGEKLYEKAHRGEEVIAPVKKMNFWNVKFQGVTDDSYMFLIECSKGSYIRTWCEQLGEKLGNLGCMYFLERTGSSPFKVEDALQLTELSEILTNGQTPQNYKPLKSCLPHLKSLRVKGKDESLMRNGVISHDLRLMLIQNFNPVSDDVIQVKSERGDLISLIGLEKEKGFQIRRVFKTQ
ncbi:MAG: tRNA pseudouridine(55) synthase TruB [Bdellovibrionota bacterium]